MILDDPEYYWIYVVPSDPFAPTLIYKGKKATKEDYLEHWGKWVIMDDKEHLDELAEDLDIAVERRWIPQIKYTRYPAPEMALDKCVMAVFCDDRERGDILQFLLVAGAMPQGWEYEKDMVESWKPGGVFLERVIAAKGLTSEEAGRFREEIPKQMEAWIEYTFGTGEKAKKLRERTFKKSGLILSAEDMNLIVDEREKDVDTGAK
jgi:hypothetical protein